VNITIYDKLAKELIGTKVPKPISGTLSGHAAGEPFDKHVYSILKSWFPDKTFRQYEYLNFLFSNNLSATDSEERNRLFNSPTVMFLLSRGKNATDKWSLENPFEEKQNDTADILVIDDNFFEIIDIKTKNRSRDPQAPNIISAYKLAQVCSIMIDNKEFDKFSIAYIEIDWLLENDFLVCKDVYHISLFKINPSELYINWASGMQIQFHVSNLKENFNGTVEEWAREYLKHFVKQAKKRAEAMIEKFVKPFEKDI